MSDQAALIAAAQRLQSDDEAALLVQLGLRERAIEADPAAAADPNLPIAYEGSHMSLAGDIKALALRILKRWNKELYGLVCPAGGAVSSDADKTLRDQVFGALHLDEAAMIAAVAPALLALGAPAALAAVLAPLIVKKFIYPMRDELCAAWGEALHA